MAKKMDMTKLDRIREASVEIISEHGILNSSVASIAERAGVSVGYLYRHYPGKVIFRLSERYIICFLTRI